MSRSVLSLRLPAHLQSKLIQNGYYTVADFDETPPSDDLSHFLTQSEVCSLASAAQAQPSARSAWSIQQQVLTQSYFSTQLPQVDALLGGRGIPLGCITEITGEAGSGQTELCLRLCLAARLPASQGGLGANSVFIDTVGSFSYRGAKRAAYRLREQQQPERLDSGSELSAMSLLDGIHVFRVYAAHELVALLYSFDQIASHVAGLGLVVINTVSWPFLASFTSNVSRRQAMHAELARLLTQIASKHKVAIVLVSLAKSGFGRSTTISSSPMDGDGWARVAANCLSLRRRSGGTDGDGFDVALSASTMHSTGEAFVRR
ncbi:DNA repair protein rad51c [Coemansia linderi]|uniref:DNA repair protein rad51c n=1 Tax=Coemansia linderi TaxID=2663919 RepID=A0ACC1KC45_9FUNG|nr:DNA repair protein rad51c [Coemansia linderi]